MAKAPDLEKVQICYLIRLGPLQETAVRDFEVIEKNQWPGYFFHLPSLILVIKAKLHV